MMRLDLILACFVLALPAFAADWSARAPEKPFVSNTPLPPDPNVLRQGGDTAADALPVPIPYSGSGTTTGYTDDYDFSCPYGSDSPDVVYRIEPEVDLALDIDLCGSSYDTKVFILDENLAPFACNDDYYDSGDPCGDWVSKLENIEVQAGATYYVVIDGYPGDHGDYLIEIAEYVPCLVYCPAGAEQEDEPRLEVDYIDEWNGGCNTDPDNPPFQLITSPVFCGNAGWFTNEGWPYRDTDWFLIEIPSSGALEITGDAMFETYMFELGPQDCGSVDVLQSVTIGPCEENTMVVSGEPGSVIWFWVGAATITGPHWLPDVAEYDYVLQLNLDPVTTETMSFSAVKCLFD